MNAEMRISMKNCGLGDSFFAFLRLLMAIFLV
jgi:hypothetical protein